LHLDEKSRPVITEKNANGEVTEWVYLPERGYALGEIHKTKYLSLQFSDFRDVKGTILPFHMVYSRTRALDNKEVDRVTLVVKSFELNDAKNDASRYQIHWPKGIEILDLHTHTRMTTTTDGQVIGEQSTGSGSEAQ